jgi:hypothetical protein
VLKKLHAAFLDKATAKLTPEMNKKLAKEVPKTLKSTTFLAKLKAAAVKLKETIRAKMMDELKPAVAQAAKLKYKTLAKEQKKVLTKKVIATKDAQLKKEMAEQTHTEKLKKPVTKKLTTKMVRQLKKKVEEVSRGEIQKLQPELKKVVYLKYKKGTAKKALADVQNQEASTQELTKIATAKAKNGCREGGARKVPCTERCHTGDPD